MLLNESYQEVEEAIASACARSNRQRASVKLLAVSKTQPDEALEQAYALGVRDFGENYVQELVGRRERLAHLKDAKWHLIGPLQSNKVKQALEVANFFHALDSESVLKTIQKRLPPGSSPWPVFIQVNIDDEATKAGVRCTVLANFISKVRSVHEVKLLGLMAIPEPKRPVGGMRPAFRKLRELSEEHLGPEALLSMGMSEDFEVAIEEGAHWVRVGRRLFGERHL